ncbi:MAG: GNAT family N-acetyltransferase [Pseudobdellovibrionaceae bacterium]
MKLLKPKSPKILIETERIYLRKHDLKQANIMFTHVNKDRRRLKKFLPWVDHVKTAEDEKKYIKRTHKGWKENTLFDFSIFRKSDLKYMGNIGVHSIKWDRFLCEFGYWILGEFEGQGYMSDAVKALESELFGIGFNRIEIRCNNLNKRSANVPLACGYTHEGTLRQDDIDMGKFRDTMVFGKLKNEWKETKNKN